MLITENILEVRQRIAAAAARRGRNPAEVKLIAVTKTVDIPQMEQALALVDGFGENRVQELQRKYPFFPDGPDWHLIGHLQTNKVKQVVGKVSLIHSLDRINLAREISSVAQTLQVAAPVLVQVNISGEESKYGLAPGEVRDFLTTLADFPGIRVQGLMTMAPLAADPEEARPVFRGLAELAGDLARENIPGVSMKFLSMGMSNDFEIAVEEGANIVRVGSAIFGSRS
ncbi:MAG TPA: YggS family pyridoxal phosphate-dependent enzyme [Verrucomicrobiae bacterium]|nr:YggS family pyridoxal phosphate-dependent enzyme [Verrucomicrobiae bacterium]